MKHLCTKILLALTLICSSQMSYAGLMLSTNNVTAQVGESFTVDLLVELTDGIGLTGFGLDINKPDIFGPSFVGVDNVSLASVTYGADLLADMFNDVGASVDFAAPPIMGTGLFQLATLNFSADSVGQDVLSFVGNDGLFGGVFYDDFSFEAIDLELNISIESVSEPSIFLMALLGLLLLTHKSRFSVKNKI